MSPNLVQTDAQRPEPALNRWRPTLGSTLALPEEHAPAERIMRAPGGQASWCWNWSRDPLQQLRQCSAAHLRPCGRPCSCLSTRVHPCSAVFSLVVVPERRLNENNLPRKQQQKKRKYIRCCFCGLFRRLQANTYLLDSGEQGSQDRAAA